MAGDTRDPDLDPIRSDDTTQPPPQVSEQTPKRRRRKPKHDFPQTQAGKLWEAFGDPEEPVNTMPGGTYNSAGGRPREYTWRDTLNFDKSVFDRFYKTGCARDSLLVGVGGGAAVGGVRVIIGGIPSLAKAANWSVGAFTLAATGMYTWCENRRRQEAVGMAQAVAGMKRLQDKKKQEEQEARARTEAAARLAEEEKRKRSWTNMENYRFWR